MTAIDVRDVTVKNQKFGPPVLENISVQIPAESMLTILGPSQAGKTALVRVLVGLDRPDDGDVVFDDIVVNAVSPRDRDIATVLQDYPLVPHKSGQSNLAFASRLRQTQHRGAIEDSVDEVIDELGLGDIAHLRPGSMSDAEKQRVAVGRALVREANAYVFDEPFSAMDGRIRDQIRSGVVAHQKRLKRTTVFTTSDPEEAMALDATIAVLHQGIIHQIASAQHMYAHPANLFVAALFGIEPINLVAGLVRGNTLDLPLSSFPIPDNIAAQCDDGDLLVVGIRPSDCQLVTEHNRPSDSDLHIAGTASEVQWKGRSQRVFLGFDLDSETETLFFEIEDSVQFTMFQPYVMANVEASVGCSVGDGVELTVPGERILFFDPLSGDAL